MAQIDTLTIACGLGTNALTSSLDYFDAFRRDDLPANLTQDQQRNFFGGHAHGVTATCIKIDSEQRLAGFN